MTTTTSLVGLSRTILGSLTTTFTAPTSCAYLGVAYVGNDLVGWEGQKCNSGSDDGLVDNQACWPGTTAGAAYPDTPFSGWGFYSPGLACPAGHSSACTATASGEADWPVQFALEAGETAVGCCPTGYACTNLVSESGQTCYLLASSTTLTTAVCSDDVLTAGLLTVPYLDAATDTASTSTLRAWAPMIQINWKASDRGGSSASATATATATAPDETTAATLGDATASTSSSSSSPEAASASSPTTGAIVGAVVGAIAGVVLIAAAAFFVWRSRRRQLREKGGGGVDGGGAGAMQWQGRSEGQYANASELPDPADGVLWRTHGEMAANERAEVGSRDIIELPANKWGPRTAVEVPA